MRNSDVRICSQLPRYEDLSPPCYDSISTFARAAVGDPEPRSMRLSMNFHRPLLRSSTGENVRLQRNGTADGRNCRRFSPTSSPLAPECHVERRTSLRRQCSSSYFNNMFVPNNNGTSMNLAAYLPRDRVSSHQSLNGRMNEMKWLEQKTTLDENHAEEMATEGDWPECHKCRDNVHLITFIWSDVEHTKCVVTNFDRQCSCYAQIPMTFWTSFGFSVCRTTFCTTRSIFLSGGHGSAAKSMQQFDLYRNKWIQCQPMLTTRRNHAMVSNGHRIYVIGGVDENKKLLQSIEVYNMKTNRWKCVGHLESPVSHPTAVKVMDDIYIFGGKDENSRSTDKIQKFVTTSNSCGMFENKFCTRVSDAKGLFKNRHVYIAGNHGLFIKFDTASKDSTRLPNHGLNRIHKIISQSSSGIEVIGQYTTDSLLVKRFDFRSNIWVTRNEFISRGQIEGVLCLSHCPL